MAKTASGFAVSDALWVRIEPPLPGRVHEARHRVRPATRRNLALSITTAASGKRHAVDQDVPVRGLVVPDPDVQHRSAIAHRFAVVEIGRECVFTGREA